MINSPLTRVSGLGQNHLQKQTKSPPQKFNSKILKINQDLSLQDQKKALLLWWQITSSC